MIRLSENIFIKKKQEIIEKSFRNSREGGSSSAFSHSILSSFSEFGGGYGGGDLPDY